MNTNVLKDHVESIMNGQTIKVSTWQDVVDVKAEIMALFGKQVIVKTLLDGYTISL